MQSAMQSHSLKCFFSSKFTWRTLLVLTLNPRDVSRIQFILQNMNGILAHVFYFMVLM